MDKATTHIYLALIKEELLLIELYVKTLQLWAEHKAGYKPEQPRIPAGQPHGGQWTDGDSQATPQKPDIDAAIKHLRKHARLKSDGKCARYVRQALNAGGFPLKPPANDKRGYAKNYGSALNIIGFLPIAYSNKPASYPPQDYTPTAGDVAVVQETSKSIAGHMAMFDGKIWISDFIQPAFWPGPSYRSEKPSFIIYRKSQD